MMSRTAETLSNFPLPAKTLCLSPKKDKAPSRMKGGVLRPLKSLMEAVSSGTLTIC